MIAGVLAILPGAAASSTDVERYYSREFTDCMEKAAATPEMQDCAAAEQKHWDDDLNAAYRRLMADLPAARQAALRGEERAWIRRKDHVCEHAGDAEQGGSLQRVEVERCYLDETIRRAVYLRSYR
jgi:uncharacterized protein YecT (DUF1311 family)